jgi:outer membrane lipoprotein SlyB
MRSDIRPYSTPLSGVLKRAAVALVVLVPLLGACAETIGAGAGAYAGNQFGKGSGKTAATVGGALGGAFLGHELAR